VTKMDYKGRRSSARQAYVQTSTRPDDHAPADYTLRCKHQYTLAHTHTHTISDSAGFLHLFFFFFFEVDLSEDESRRTEFYTLFE
jgi:hypothetical protein